MKTLLRSQTYILPYAGSRRFPTSYDVFENKSKSAEKILRVILLSGLAVGLIVAVLLQFGFLRTLASRPKAAGLTTQVAESTAPLHIKRDWP